MQNFAAWMNSLNSFVWGPAMLLPILAADQQHPHREFGVDRYRAEGDPRRRARRG